MNNNIYFPGINGLRFIAALAVIITHIELMKHKLGYANIWENPLVHNLGVIGVSFFFVLSGFLITYLMLAEKKRFNFFSIKKFYLRRILRIWPLYFLIFSLGFFVLPYFTYVPFFSEKLSHNFLANMIFYILILPNFAFSIFSAVPLIGQTWSIGVEEQFYLIWPIFFRVFKNFDFKLLINFILFWLFFKLLILLTVNYYDMEWLLVLKKNLSMLKFENMIIGAMGALLLIENKANILKFIYNKIILVFSILGIFISIYIIPDFFNDAIHILHSVFFLIILLNVSSNPESLINLENKVFNFLGRISYGIYMYHLVVIYFVIKLLEYFSFFNEYFILSSILLYFFSIIISCLIAYISYELFEKKFLRLKAKYSKVKSSS